MKNITSIRPSLVFASIIIISIVMHFNHFSKDLLSIHVWRQTQTQSTIDNFYKEDFNILNPRKNDRGDGNGIFRMEFPLMQWCVAGIYKIFGQHLIITRISMFIIGVFSVIGIYVLLNNLFSNKYLALAGAWAFNFSPSFYYYTINPLPDNMALCASVWGLALFFKWKVEQKNLQLFASSILLSVAALCKLPFIVYYSVPVVYFLKDIIRDKTNKRLWAKLLLSLVGIVFPITWYIYVIPGWHGNGIVKGMMENTFSVSVLFDYFQHNLISTLPELLINYGAVPFFIAGFYFFYKSKKYSHPLFLPLLSLAVALCLYFFFELNMIAKIHDYYLFPFYPLLFIIVAYGAFNMYNIKMGGAKFIVLVLLFILPFTAYLRMQNRWDTDSPGFNRDLLVYKNDLRSAISPNALCIAGNDNSHFIFLYYIDKKGWVFSDDSINAGAIKDMINKGARVLYSDSRKIDENVNVLPFLDTLIMERGTVKVFQLKNSI